MGTAHTKLQLVHCKHEVHSTRILGAALQSPVDTGMVIFTVRKKPSQALPQNCILPSFSRQTLPGRKQSFQGTEYLPCYLDTCHSNHCDKL